MPRVRLGVWVWDARALKPLAGPLRHEGLSAYRLTTDGKTVLTAGEADVRLWGVATSKVRSADRPATGH
jgi:hypothetical protein